MLASVLCLVTWPPSLVRALNAGSSYPSWYLVGSMVALTMALVACLIQAGLPDGPDTALRGYCLVTVAIAVVPVFGMWHNPGSLDYDPFNVSVFLGLVLIPVSFPTVFAVPLAAAGMFAYWWRRVGVVGLAQGCAETAILMGVLLAVALMVRTVLGDVTRMDRVLTREQRRTISITAALERRRVRERWNAMVHDKVLAALTLASRDQVPDAALLASAALRDLHGVRLTPGDDPQSRIMQQASALGLRLDLDAATWPGGATGEALEGATCEAILNVGKHARVDAVRVSARRAGHRWTVVVSDAGRGFDPEAVGENRFGLRRRVTEAVEAVGGSVEVDASPGTGTRITLTAPEESPLTRSREPGGLFRFRETTLALLVALAGFLYIGSQHVGESTLPQLDVAALVLIPLVTLLMGVANPRSIWSQIGLVAAAVLLAALIGVTMHPQVADWRLWYIGAFDVCIWLIGLRRGMWHAVAVLTLGILAGTGVLFLRGERDFLVPLVSSVWQGYVWALTAGSIKRIMDDSFEVLTDRNDAAAADEAEMLAASREEDTRAELPVVSPATWAMLRRIAMRDDLSAQDRLECVRLESSTRDQLMAHTLLTPDLVGNIRAARDEGARVVIVGTLQPRKAAGTDAPQDPRTEAALGRFRAAATDLLAAAAPGDRVQLTWRPDALGRYGSASLVGCEAGTRWARSPHPQLDMSTGLLVTDDEDTVLVEVVA